MPLKNLVKAARDGAVAAVGPHRWPRSRPRLLILTYHRVLPADHPELRYEQPGMVVYPETLDMHLRVIQRYYQPVSLAQWVEAVRSGAPVPAKAFAVTFDDGWRDNAEYALPILQRHKIPATLFVVSEYVDSGLTFWPERIGWLLTHQNAWRTRGEPLREWLNTVVQLPEEAGEMTVATVDACITGLKSRYSDEAIIARLDELALDAGGPPPSVVSGAELSAMVATGLVDVGSHTLTHKRLTTDVSDREIERQVRSSKEELQARLQAPISLFCYPNGDVSRAAEQAVSRFYRGAVTTRAGQNRTDVDLFRLQRFNLHQGNSATSRSFISRVSGWV